MNVIFYYHFFRDFILVMASEAPIHLQTSPLKRKDPQTVDSPSKRLNNHYQQIIRIPYYYGYSKFGEAAFQDISIELKFFINMKFPTPDDHPDSSLVNISRSSAESTAGDDMDVVARYMATSDFCRTKFDITKIFVPHNSQDLLIYFKLNHRFYPMYLTVETPLPLIEVAISNSTIFVFNFRKSATQAMIPRRFRRDPYNEISSDTVIVNSEPITRPADLVSLTVVDEISLSIHCIVGSEEISGKIHHSSPFTQMCLIVGKQSFVVKLIDEELQDCPGEKRLSNRFFRTIFTNDPNRDEHDFEIDQGNHFIHENVVTPIAEEDHNFVMAFDTAGTEWPLEINSCVGCVYQSNERLEQKTTDFRQYFLFPDSHPGPGYILRRGTQRLKIVNDPRERV